MQGVRMVQISVPATVRQITVLRRAAKCVGLTTPSQLLAAMFDGHLFLHRRQPSYTTLRQFPGRPAQLKL